MEVEEERTSNHLEEIIAATTTTVIKDGLLENCSSTDKESEKELSNLISKSNTQEEGESSVPVPKLEDSEPFVVAAVGEKQVDEKGMEEVLVHCRNSESAAALSGGITNSAVDECANVVECSKGGDVKEIEMPTDDVAAVEYGGSELTCSDKVGAEDEATEIERNGGLEVVEGMVENSGEDDNFGDLLVIEKDENKGDEMVGEEGKRGDDLETKEEEGAEVLKVEVMDQKNEVENVDSVQEMAGGDAINDGDGGVHLEKTDSVQGEEAMAEVQDDHKEGVVAEEAVKEEGIVADEEEAVGVRDDSEVRLMVDGPVDGVAENDDEETMVEDEEKPLDTEMETEEEAGVADEEKDQDAEIETEAELPESSVKGSGGKRKRGGKISKTTPMYSSAGEDVCFICFDGGDLVLCDHRFCPKAYHPDCTNRDEAFFLSRGRWNCGWHQCSNCERKAEYMCYTCTYSLCKACSKTSVLFCIREKEKKGLCEDCMESVMLIEKPEDQGNVNMEDKNSWDSLFKDYWTETKAKHNLSLAELEKAKNPHKGAGKQKSQVPLVKDNGGLGTDENLVTGKNRRQAKKRKSTAKEEDSSTGAAAAGSEGTSEWASKELLDLVTHMRNGDKSFIPQFEVQNLLLQYITTNKLRDTWHKSQIICDARLKSLFGKPRVAHFEMLKLLESHFLIKEDPQIDDIQGMVVDTDISQVDDDDRKDRKRKGRKKGDRRGPQSNREDYAAIDIHNISLIYLRRKLVEDLLDDMETFYGKIVGTFVRIRISGANQKQDIYRLVQVSGTSEAAQYTIGKRTTCIMLEILNLDKTETISIDSISNQEFTEDECKRLKQSIKCGLIKRLTVGGILDKAMELQAARVNDWFETEVVRLNHLRDRASDLGRKKELRECVEKLQVLKKPEERARRLEEFPLIHDDPTMDPDHESEDDTDPDDKKQELYTRSDSFRFNKKVRDQYSSPRGDHTPKESWSGTPRSSNRNYEFSRNFSSKSFSPKVEDANRSSENHNENSWDPGSDPFVQSPIVLKKPNFETSELPETSPTETAPKVNESEKMWHYKDPSGKIQGPFSMVQLRKWSKNGYFPVGLRIWRKSEKEDDGILLTDALEGQFLLVEQRNVSRDVNSATVDNPKPLPDSRHEFGNLPSPTPNKSATGWTGDQAVGLSLYASGNERLQSPTPNTAQEANADGNEANAVVAPNNPDQGIVLGSQNSQLGQVVAPPEPPPLMVQPVAGQNPQNWSNVPPQNLQPDPSMNMAGLQQLPYNPWGGFPNMVQNPVGNFMPQPATGLQEPWGQLPFPVNQANMQPPPQPNVNWATMPANSNMGWAGPMNWGPATGNVNPGWVMQPGWVPAPPVQGAMPNQGWVAAPPQGPVPANGNPGWVGQPPPGNQGAPNPVWVAPPANTHTGWVGPPGNQSAPAANQGPGWVPPPGNQGAPPPPQRNRLNWGGNEQQQNRGNFSGPRRNRGSGFRGNRRNWNNNRQDSFRKDGRGGRSGDSEQ